MQRFRADPAIGDHDVPAVFDRGGVTRRGQMRVDGRMRGGLAARDDTAAGCPESDHDRLAGEQIVIRFDFDSIAALAA
ncbi:MAG TPA: hypothetical protein VMU82_12140 [Acetobacteraceae bacterium]|nr:hypothetical protein [Acetobacteraceae bacterium]